MEREKEIGKLGWWWLSFADETGFLGVCIVEGVNTLGAIRQADKLGINPGGEVAATPVVYCTVFKGQTNRLLNRDEAEKLANS